MGVLLAAAAGVGAFVYVRRQKQKKVEEDYRRNLATMEYGVKKPESDMRLDPVMLQRRMSDGSIADNQDYSRRILKVSMTYYIDGQRKLQDNGLTSLGHQS